MILKKMGFTLAEVLITLTIIGVVAAVTVPTLVKKTGNEETVSRLMKTYSALSQATEQILMEKGSPKVWNTDVVSLYNTYKSYTRNAKECGSSAGCLAIKLNSYKWMHNGKVWNGGTENAPDANESYYQRLTIADGVVLIFSTYNLSPDCNSETSLGDKGVCAIIMADVNGRSEPNTWGRDLFQFVLKEDGIYPAGCDMLSDCIDENGNPSYGRACACKIISEGAMNY